MSLTKTQQLILSSIEQFKKEHVRSPTYRELIPLLGFSSTGSLSRHIRALREKGYLVESEKKWHSLASKPKKVQKNIEILGTIGEKISFFSEPITIAAKITETQVYAFLVEEDLFSQYHILKDDVIVISQKTTQDMDTLVVYKDKENRVGIMPLYLLESKAAEESLFFGTIISVIRGWQELLCN